MSDLPLTDECEGAEIMSKWLIVIYCLTVLSVVCSAVGVDRNSVNGVRSRRRSLFDAQVERQHLVQKYFKKLNTAEGKLKLVGGSADNEGARDETQILYYYYYYNSWLPGSNEK